VENRAAVLALGILLLAGLVGTSSIVTATKTVPCNVTVGNQSYVLQLPLTDKKTIALDNMTIVLKAQTLPFEYITRYYPAEAIINGTRYAVKTDCAILYYSSKKATLWGYVDGWFYEIWGNNSNGIRFKQDNVGVIVLKGKKSFDGMDMG